MLTGTLLELLIAALAFTGGHFMLSSRLLRPALASRLGENAFLGAYSLFSALTLIWMVLSYAAAPDVPLWDPPAWSRWLALAVMPFATTLAAAALRKDNPTSVTGVPGKVDPRRLGIFAVTRNPLMWGIGLWAVSHIPANGDAASLILFGALLLLALPGTLAIEARKRVRDPAGWQAFAAVTSNLPLAALLSGRARLSASALLSPVAIGLTVYAVLLALHPLLFGVSPLPL